MKTAKAEEQEVAVICPRCWGTGVYKFPGDYYGTPELLEETCSKCSGYGKIRVPMSTLKLEVIEETT